MARNLEDDGPDPRMAAYLELKRVRQENEARARRAAFVPHPNSLANLKPMPRLPPGVAARAHRTLGEPRVLEWWASFTPTQRGEHLAQLVAHGPPPLQAVEGEQAVRVHRTVAPPKFLEKWSERTPAERGAVLLALAVKLQQDKDKERVRAAAYKEHRRALEESERLYEERLRAQALQDAEPIEEGEGWFKGVLRRLGIR